MTISSGFPTRGKEATSKTKTEVVDNIRRDFVEVGWGDVDWIGLAQDRDRYSLHIM
jgi:hypothetical protein